MCRQQLSDTTLQQRAVTSHIVNNEATNSHTHIHTYKNVDMWEKISNQQNVLAKTI